MNSPACGSSQKVFSLIEPRWVDYYGIDRERYELLSMPAASLLKPQRFDLFARLYYIRHRRDNARLARRVYLESLRALVPTWKEHGKEKEKSGPCVHIKVFNELIDRFESTDFDPDVSLVPVGKGDVIIDGSHRTSSLAFYHKDVTVCRFDYVDSEYFNYVYYLDYGLSVHAADLAAYEAVGWFDGLNVLCVWPGGGCPDFDDTARLYVREFKLRGSEYQRLRSILDPSWRDGENKKVPSKNKTKVSFVFFLSDDLVSPCPTAVEGSLLIKDRDEVRRVAELVLTDEGRCRWNGSSPFADWFVVHFRHFAEHAHADYRYYLRRVKLFFGRMDNRVWIFFYNLVSPLWKKQRS